jgi:hypothetical protein
MHEAELSIERAKDLPDEAYWQMVEALIKLTTLEAKAAKDHSQGAQQLKQEYAAQLASCLGPERLSKYLAVREELTEQLRTARQTVVTTRDGHQELEAIRLQMLERSRDFLTQLGVDLGLLEELTGALHGRAAALLRGTTGIGEHGTASQDAGGAQQARQSQLPQLPLGRQPPFHGTSSFVNQFRYTSEPGDDLAVPSFDVYLSRFTGEVGSSTHTHLSDASGYGTAWVLCRTAVLSWFRMPSTGQVRVSVTLETVSDNYSGSIVNECGESGIDLRQGRMLYGQVISPSVSERAYASFGSTSLYHDTDAGAHNWLYDRSSTGQPHRSQALVIPGVFAAGAWVLVNVGIEHFNFFSSNDCSVTSWQMSRFKVREIALESTGA